jgi:hypothetical protein
MKIEKCLDENLLVGLPYMVDKFTSTNLTIEMKSHMKVSHPCANFDNLYIDSNKGKTHTTLNNVSTSHKSSKLTLAISMATLS